MTAPPAAADVRARIRSGGHAGPPCGRTGNDLAPAFFQMVAAVVSLGTVLPMRETAARPLPELAAAGAGA